MKSVSLYIGILFIVSCSGNKSSVTTLVETDSLKAVRLDSIGNSDFIRKLDFNAKLLRLASNLPLIDTYKQEVYCYGYSGAFKPIQILQIERTQDSSYLLTSCFIISDLRFHEKLPNVSYKKIPDYYEGRTDSMLLFTDKQAITMNEWFGFLIILRGSYYWTFTNPMPNDGILDGDFLSLISKSFWPRHYDIGDTLAYHRVSIHCPFKGSFTDAYIYLFNKSKLFRKLNIRPPEFR